MEQTALISGARRRAVRDGDRRTDTAHLLHSLLELDPGVRAAFDGGAPQVARLLGYLAQRSIGYGIRWRRAAEGSGALPRISAGGVPRFTPVALAVMDGALARARAMGREPAGLDLLAVMAASGECRAAEVLTRAGVDTERLVKRLGGLEPAGPVPAVPGKARDGLRGRCPAPGCPDPETGVIKGDAPDVG